MKEYAAISIPEEPPFTKEQEERIKKIIKEELNKLIGI